MITGGIGSGKSTVRALLESKGFLTLDADSLAHEALQSPSVMAEVERIWPRAIVGGRVDRGKLAAVVFGDPAELRRLEGLIHPLVREKVRRWVESVPPEADLALEVSVPKAVDRSGWTLVVVYAPESGRRRRLLDRGMDPEDVDARLAAQPSDSEWLDLADLVLVNDDDLGTLEAELCRLLEENEFG
ncbi:MAG: dephospho-CoA kinase [Acidimicrobiia bacterium]|nr:MAG: dephospho-CoA kinase [Acidimicrobiia bacterium]